MRNISKFFPFHNFRPYQEKILRDLKDNIDSYDYIFLEAPTGFGKSVVAYTLAKYLLDTQGDLTHICVGDKYLQEQYLRDFGEIALVKGRGNFNCLIRPTLSCSEGECNVKNFDCPCKPRARNEDDKLVYDKHGLVYDWDDVEFRCPYWDQKVKGIESDLTIHNYHYFLYEQNYSHAFTRRQLGIFDEAHIIENILMQFVSLTVIRRSLAFIRIRESIPNYSTIDEWLSWLKRIEDLLIEQAPRFDEMIVKLAEMQDEKKIKDTMRDIKRYKNLLRDVGRIITYIVDEPDNWVWLRDEERITFKPVVIKKHSHQLFNYVEKKVMMSATILDHEMLQNYLGIEEDTLFLRVENSTFPKENRLFIQDHQGRATYKTMPEYLAKVMRRIDDYYIPNKKADKGVIHTHTNKIANHILRNSRHNNILVSNVGSQFKREDVFQRFFDSEPPRVMVTPSMKLGIDLKDDLCRWQLIIKVPYPSLGDPQIKKRLKIDPKWYTYQTVLALIQTYGRGCRSDTDYCQTFILDTKFTDIASRNWKILPKWFKEAICAFSDLTEKEV